MAEGCGHPALPCWCSQPPWALASPSPRLSKRFLLAVKKEKRGASRQEPQDKTPCSTFFCEVKPGWSHISPFKINIDHARNCPVTCSASASLQTVNASVAWSPSLTICKSNRIHQMRCVVKGSPRQGSAQIRDSTFL